MERTSPTHLFSSDSEVKPAKPEHLNAEQIFVDGGVPKYISLCHKIAMGSKSYSDAATPKSFTTYKVNGTLGKKQVPESNFLPNFSASLMNALFSYSHELSSFHETWDSEKNPELYEQAIFSSLINKVCKRKSFAKLRGKTKGSSIKSISSVARIVFALRRNGLIPEANLNKDIAPDQANAKFSDFQAQIDSESSSISKMLREASESCDSYDKLEQSVSKAFGATPGKGYDDTSPNKAPTQADMDLMDLFFFSRVWLQTFVEKVGKYTGTLGAIRRKHKSVVGKPLPDIGDDFMSADPLEYALMQTTAKASVLMRASRGLLSVTSMFESEQKAGPITVAIDVSGSMGFRSRESNKSESPETAKEYSEYSYINAARAIGASVALTALKNGRPIRILGFNRSVQNELDLSPEDSGSVQKILAFTSWLSSGGGTCFTAPLNRAYLFNKEHSGRADMVIITDGHGELRDHRQGDPRIFSIVLGLISESTQHILARRSEELAHIRSVNKPDQVELGLTAFSKALDE